MGVRLGDGDSDGGEVVMVDLDEEFQVLRRWF